MKEIPSYIKDTDDFINKINNHNIPKESIFVRLDVKSLYTSIPNPEGIAAVKKAHERYQHKTVPTKVTTTFLALILTLNNSIFNSKSYLQIKGCTMGTICAPPYANIFMAYFEEKFIYPLIRNAATLYLRYIDDIILIWTKSENELLTFFEKLNQQHPSIKFEMKYSKDKIEFLDTLIYKDKNNNIQTTLYKKPTDRQNYIHSKSAHPFSLKKSIAYSQALRLKRICSTTGEYEKHTENLKKQLIKKGYPETMVNEEIQKATNQNRTGLLNRQKTETGNHLTLCVTYNRTLRNIKKILEKHWHILNVNPELK